MNTPTPWRISKTDEFRILDTKNGKLVADASGNIDMTDDEAENNAALIVRAVNSHQSLIDALEKIIKADAYRMAAIAAPDGEKHYEPATENFWAAIDKGRAALALAKEPT